LGLTGPLLDQVYFERLERPWWRPGDLLPMEVIFTVVTIAPDSLLVLVELHDTVEMGAGSGEGSDICIRHANQDDRFDPEANDLETPLEQLGIVDRAGLHLIGRSLRYHWRADELEDRIKKSCEERSR
jgi:hypothetical protein